jgi:hypothetical protein
MALSSAIIRQRTTSKIAAPTSLSELISIAPVVASGAFCYSRNSIILVSKIVPRAVDSGRLAGMSAASAARRSGGEDD